VLGGAITTATDVYALGTVLYELLTSKRPHQFETYSPAAIERAICDTEAPRPSDAARQQTTAPAKIARQLEGDLDNIVLMALRKEPARRYQSVEQFSEDIRRYLEGLPVLARKDTFVYRASKFALRHKAGVVILILLAMLAITMTVQTFRISQERDRANQAAITAETMTQSLISLFEFADPGKTLGNSITAKELLDQSVERVVRDLNDQPIIQARLMDTLGGLYQRIGVYDRAQALLESSLNLRRKAPNADLLDVAASLNHLAELLKLRGDFDNCERLHRESLAIRSKLLPADHLDMATSLNDLGTLLVERNKLDEAEPMFAPQFGDTSANCWAKSIWKSSKA
jgi:tetratricopeptide (TPR) repeat protein